MISFQPTNLQHIFTISTWTFTYFYSISSLDNKDKSPVILQECQGCCLKTKSYPIQKWTKSISWNLSRHSLNWVFTKKKKKKTTQPAEFVVALNYNNDYQIWIPRPVLTSELCFRLQKKLKIILL